jgi:hypothetical protein
VQDRWNCCGCDDSANLFRAFHAAITATCTVWVRLRGSFRLPPIAKSLEFTAFKPTVQHLICSGQLVILHKYDEIINGRAYHIEVANVGAGQWRANIKRTPGGSAALMPFYGKTPDEAARQLSQWLAIAHGTERPRI